MKRFALIRFETPKRFHLAGRQRVLSLRRPCSEGVFNKDMTYVKQLKDYEDAVMAKRLEELPEAELEKMMEEISKLDPK